MRYIYLFLPTIFVSFTIASDIYKSSLNIEKNSIVQSRLNSNYRLTESFSKAVINLGYKYDKGYDSVKIVLLSLSSEIFMKKLNKELVLNQEKLSNKFIDKYIKDLIIYAKYYGYIKKL